MTGYRSSAFRHDCGRDGCYYAQLPDWEPMMACFPRGIRPTDVDGMVELGGRLLFIEEKRAGAAPSNGQLRAFRRLSQLPDTTVVLTRPGSRCEREFLVLGQYDNASGWLRTTEAKWLGWLRDWAANPSPPEWRAS